ncbi:hypothetical protein Ga0100231_008420 [Opitutaceae bacterium TAV4]|nr:hypothetical protein Ga0100231_008420 [Opitutaceae bacterium TAV4]RRJ98469.1 hypothetical protein Ga0100230_008700 [Opitutaceae bacterium TAV3]
MDSFRGISDVKLYWSNDSKNLGVTMTNDFYQNATFQNTNKIIVKTEHEAGSTEHQLMGWIEVDVTSFVQAEFAAQASESTVRAWLRLQADLWAGVAKGNGTALRFGFDGLDRANPPQLVITTAATSIPEPRVTGFFILIPAGLLAFVLRRKYHP